MREKHLNPGLIELSFLVAFTTLITTSCSTPLKEKPTTYSSDKIESTTQKINSSDLASLIPYQEGSEISAGETVKGSVNQAINLPQGWTESSQQEFYYTSQGSQILPYSWYLALEQANSKTLFRDNNNIQRFAYIPSNPTDINPDGLSVGFTKSTTSLTSNPPYYREWVGLTCAACHTTEVYSSGTTIRIDGGPAMADFQMFNRELVAALEATLANKAKFQRFAKSVLSDDSTTSMKTLRNDLQKQKNVLANRNHINHLAVNQAPYGFARVDAIGAIFNQVLSTFTNNKNNARASTAPVSYPFIWGTHQSNVVQWTGFAPNGPFTIGALIRNAGEVLGVYGDIQISDDKSIIAYPSSLSFEGLGKLESRVAQLRSPQWSEQYLSPIDPKLKEHGRSLYKQYCANCHEVIPRENEGKPYKAVLTDLSDIRTDSTEILNLITSRDALLYYERKEFGVFGSQIPYTTSGLAPLVNAVMGTIIDQPEEAIKAVFTQLFAGKLAEDPSNGINVSDKKKAENKAKVDELYRKLEIAYQDFKKAYRDCNKNKLSKGICHFLVELAEKGLKKEEEIKNKDKSAETLAGITYKARPLNGIWATAPYLHNGSVANLMELLKPESHRLKQFYVGSRELDLINVGFVTDKSAENRFLFDTKLPGNSNSGHTYGTTLQQYDKQALVEYMKTL